MMIQVNTPDPDSSSPVDSPQTHNHKPPAAVSGSSPSPLSPEQPPASPRSSSHSYSFVHSDSSNDGDVPTDSDSVLHTQPAQHVSRAVHPSPHHTTPFRLDS